jgi:hypothetical protein
MLDGRTLSRGGYSTGKSTPPMYALVAGGWKMTMHTGVLRYE